MIEILEGNFIWKPIISAGRFLRKNPPAIALIVVILFNVVLHTIILS